MGGILNPCQEMVGFHCLHQEMAGFHCLHQEMVDFLSPCQEMAGFLCPHQEMVNNVSWQQLKPALNVCIHIILSSAFLVARAAFPESHRWPQQHQSLPYYSTAELSSDGRGKLFCYIWNVCLC